MQNDTHWTKEENSKIVAYDDLPVGGGGGGGKGELIEIDYDWGKPPPRIAKRFGKKKGKKGEKKPKGDEESFEDLNKSKPAAKKNEKDKSKAAKRAEKKMLLEKRKKYDPWAAIKKEKQGHLNDSNSIEMIEEKSVKLEDVKNGNDQTE